MKTSNQTSAAPAKTETTQRKRKTSHYANYATRSGRRASEMGWKVGIDLQRAWDIHHVRA